MKLITFKSDREDVEFKALQGHNPRLVRLIETLAEFTSLEFKKGLVITSVFRTQDEHDQLYKHTAPEKKPKTSPHMVWQAVDLRSWVYSDREIERMLAFLNTFSYQGGQRKVAIYHTVAGNAAHFHIQYS